MKNIKSFFLAVLMFTFCASIAFAQSLNEFLKYEGVKTIAELAHPTNTFVEGYYQIYEDAIVVDIYYTNDIRTKLQLGINDGWFTKVDVLYDNDWFPPFLGVELIKDVCYETIKEMNTDDASRIWNSYEKWLNKRIIDWTGKEISIMVMTLSWAAY